MKPTRAIAALLLSASVGLTACSSDGAVGESAGSTSSAPTTGGDEDANTTSVMPPGAKPGSADFPFPVPEDWTELEPFTAGKIGKTAAMSASFGFPGEAESDAATYRQLLEKAGFKVHPNPLGEQVNDAAFIAEGKVNGTPYLGMLDFNTDADGTKRVAISLTED